MKIGVLSDTHIPFAASRIPEGVYNAFKGVDLILHAGDLIDMSVVDELSKLAKTQAVYGNMDSPEVRKVLPDKRIIKAGRFTIGLTHGYGPPFNLTEKIRKEFTQKVNVIVFGHSHNPVNKIENGILFFNPGSPTDKIFSIYNSCGILTVGAEIKGEIIRL